MKAFDLRLIVFAGALIFGGSCFLNIHMNPDFGGPQFQIGNIIRALGQPFTIVPHHLACKKTKAGSAAAAH
jgi:MFS transporter, DHA2 family, multidrug resistance protein